MKLRDAFLACGAELPWGTANLFCLDGDLGPEWVASGHCGAFRLTYPAGFYSRWEKTTEPYSLKDQMNVINEDAATFLPVLPGSIASVVEDLAWAGVKS